MLMKEFREQELTRKLEMALLFLDKLKMSEKVIERPGYPHNGFSSCCVTAGMSKEKFNFLRGEMNKCFPTYCTAFSAS